MMRMDYHKPLRWFKNIQKKNFKQLILDNIIDGSDTNLQKSMAIALGVFIGVTPFWGYQMIIVIALSHIFKLNKVLSVLASNISMPPMTPFVIYFSYLIGLILIGGNQKVAIDTINWEFVKLNLGVYLLGSFVLATLMAGGIAAFSYVLLSIFRKPKLPQV